MSGKVSDNVGLGSGSITEPAGGVEIRSDDPTLSEGLTWYNTTDNVLKVAREVTAWSAGGALATGREAGTGHGTMTAGLAASGSTSSGATVTCEEYDGSSWSSGNDRNTAKANAGASGVLTSALAFGGGSRDTTTESHDGSSWTNEGGLAAGKNTPQGAGLSETSSLSISGDTAHNTYVTTVEEYNGSAWSSGDAVSIASSTAGYNGTNTSCMKTGGWNGSAIDDCETYNGSSWTTVAVLPLGNRRYAGYSGDASSGINYTGDDGTTRFSTSEDWNGSSWSTGESVGTAKTNHLFSGDTSTEAWFTGGTDGTQYRTTTEEYQQSLTARTVTTS